MQQLSVFLENKSGRLAEVTHCLGQANISIRAVTITDTNDFGILRLVVDQPEAAEAVLQAAHFTVKTSQVLAVEIADQPGALANLMELFHHEKINIEYLYASLEKNRDGAVIIFKAADYEHCLKVVRTTPLTIIDAF